MAEGSQVDWAGHVNNLDYLITEMKDLDTAIEWALEYAKDNDDTLVVVTSDHETGGLLIEPANPVDYTSQGVKITDISTDDGNLEDVFVELTKN